MISVAWRAMEMPVTLETMGTVREARGLASMMYTSSSQMANCTFRMPFTWKSLAILAACSSMVRTCLGAMVTGGMAQAESPEWMPASSICSITVATKVSVPSASASTSASMALSRKRSISMGYSGLTWMASTP